MERDVWITPDEAINRLTWAGYMTERADDRIRFRKSGHSGRVTIHQWGVDESAITRIIEGVKR